MAGMLAAMAGGRPAAVRCLVRARPRGAACPVATPLLLWPVFVERRLGRASSRESSSSAAARTNSTAAAKTSIARANALPDDDTLVGMSGGEIFHEMMLRHGVKHIFGYPGGAILPVFDAIYNSKHFEFILPRHEQGAGHMAEGYARASGKPGVVLVTSGPGATNIITALQDALSDGTPLVAFCGQVPTSAMGTDAFQEADTIGISRACTKWNVMVKDIRELPRRMNEAFALATSGRPGPVLVDLPKDVTAGILRQPIPIQSFLPPKPSPLLLIAKESAEDLRNQTLIRVAKLINSAKKPIVFAGQGLLARPEGPSLLRELADRAIIPVTTTLEGLGAYDEMDEKSLHMIGMHGSAYANMAMQTADLIIALGARFDDRVTGDLSQFAPEARAAALRGEGGIIHFEISPKNINKVVEATEAVEGDAADSLAELLPSIKPIAREIREPWLAQIADWKNKYPFHYTNAKSDELIKPQSLVEELCRQANDYGKEKVIITTGVGQHQMWVAQHYRWRYPRTMITSGGLGTMGFGLPAAIGAKVARPDAIVIDVDGDASFSMTAMELATAAQYNIGIKVIVLNNEFQGMVQQWQDIFYKKRYSHTRQVNPDFVKLAESMNVRGIRASSQRELPEKMRQLLEHDGPVLLEAMVTRGEHVYPMVPAGKALHQLLLSPTLQAPTLK